MHILIWVIVIAMLIGLGMILKRNLLANQAAALADEPPAAQKGFAAHLTYSLTNMVQERLQKLPLGLGRQKKVDTVAQFRAWAAGSLAANREVQQWLDALNDEQIAALSEHMAAFCHDMGFDLAWLLDNQLAQNKGLQQGLTQIVLFYSRASYEAVKLQEEVQIFHIYREYMQNPQSRENRELGEHLFGKLVEQGMSTVSISEHLAASARTRQRQIVETISACAQEEPQRLHTLLKSVLTERTLARINSAMPATGEAAAVNLNGAAKVAANS
ncbi:MAG: hypothetical protein KDE54_35645 [Caldilineaceae bacterium]|nr:hypothetical protein [Caldilineaceae bacterium]MCB0143664.1 hypothetical protein [Caldilineaceae bacterium]